MNKMSDDIRKIVNEARLKTNDSTNIEQIREVWDTETCRIEKQEKLCSTLRNELESMTATLENIGNITDEDKMKLEQQKSELEKTVSDADAALEEAFNKKAEVLSKFGQDFKNRYEFICWERDKVTSKTTERKSKVEQEKARHEEALFEAEGVLDEVKTKYFQSVALENEKVSRERLKVDQRKKDTIKKSIVDQRECNEKVAKYRSLLTRRQENIYAKKKEMEEMRSELTEAMRGKSEESKRRANELRETLNDRIEDVHELERNHEIVKSEEDRVIQNMLEELKVKKEGHNSESAVSENVLKEFEKMSRERLLLLQDEVNTCEKGSIQCRSDIERDEEKLKDIDKLNESETAKLDTDLLYVGYLIDKEFPKDSDSEELAAVLQSKQTLEELNENYRHRIESIKGESDGTWKPLVDNREQAQVVLEDLVRARGNLSLILVNVKRC